MQSTVKNFYSKIRSEHLAKRTYVRYNKRPRDERRREDMLVFHVDANSAYLSWTAAALLEQGYEVDLRTIPSVISGNPENRHGIILTKSIPAKKYGIQTGESLFEAKKKCSCTVRKQATENKR